MIFGLDYWSEEYAQVLNHVVVNHVIIEYKTVKYEHDIQAIASYQRK